MEIIKSNEPKARKRYNYYKYFQVNRNDTAITTVSTNDFKKAGIRNGPSNKDIDFVLSYQLSGDVNIFRYTDIAKAMEKAKACALAYIDQLIKEGDAGMPALLQYRIDHYEDLHINLVEANIQIVEDETEADKNFRWKPYRIKI